MPTPSGVVPYAICAIGGVIFLLLSLMIGDHDGGHDVGHDMGHNGGHDVDHDGHQLNFFSLRTIAAFITGFGAAGGTAAYYYLPHFISGPIGLAVGGLMAYGVAFFVRWLQNQQANSSYSLTQVEGCNGVLIRRIPIGGVGRVKVMLGNEPIEQDARLEDTTLELSAGSQVTITVASATHFIVKPITQQVVGVKAAVTNMLQTKERGVHD